MLNVKNTISEWLAGILAPHYCIACGEIGAILCQSCNENITSEPYTKCLKCQVPTRSGGLCAACTDAYDRAWCVGERDGALRRLIDDLKFHHVRGAHQALAQLLDGALPILPSSVVITNVPTIPAHIRRRGYDHSYLIARELARLRGLPYCPLLYRKTNDVQLGATRSLRVEQAKHAFGAREFGMPDVVLLVDDVFTTGSTVRYAAQALRNAGVREVWVAVVARQELD